jgi:quercetin dioxygenase-like cupin family protein
MQRAEFEATLAKDGYEIVTRKMAPNTVNPDHTHDFDARVLVTEGAITITRAGQAARFEVGEWWAVPAGELHAEHAGPEGVSYVAGRRKSAA